MPRARNIKPGFYKNEELAECSVWARFIFPGLWMMADREGRLEDRPKRIKAELLPFDTQPVEPLLAELAARGFIVRYQIDGASYIQISKFAEHQNPHYSEKQSVIKPPTFPENEPMKEANSRSAPEISGSPPGLKRGSQHPDSLNPDSLNPESGEKRARKRAKTPLPPGFALSDRVVAWANAKGYAQLPAHLDAFKLKAEANDYRYADWDAALMNAIDADWAGIRSGRGARRDEPRGADAIPLAIATLAAQEAADVAH